MFKKATLETDPFRYFTIPRFITPDFHQKIVDEFPHVVTRGSFPIQSLKLTPLYHAMIAEFFSSDLKKATAEKFGIDLDNACGMITIRGHTGPEDGKIHIDSKGKVVTFLLYLNENWHESSAGNLRILKGPDNIDDFSAEVAPQAGTLIVFQCTDHAWHGHLPFDGERRTIQFNFVQNTSYRFYERLRHRVSAFLKQTKAFFKNRVIV